MEHIIKYPRTKHLQGSALQEGDSCSSQVKYSALAGRWIVIEEKADGANSGVSFNLQALLHLQSRGHFLVGGGREKHFDLFKRWAAAKEVELYTWLGDQYVMYGEWMGSKHTVFYDYLPHLWLEFDIFDKAAGTFLSTTARRRLLGQRLVSFTGQPSRLDTAHQHAAILATNGTVVSAPVLYEGIAPKTLAELLSYIRPSCAKTVKWKQALKEQAERQGLDADRIMAETEGVDLMEGLYIKVEEGDETVDRYKWVRRGFIQTITDNDQHWLARPIIPNQLAPGVDIFADDCLAEVKQGLWPMTGEFTLRKQYVVGSPK